MQLVLSSQALIKQVTLLIAFPIEDQQQFAL